jgi:hypothetical protein
VGSWRRAARRGQLRQPRRPPAPLRCRPSARALRPGPRLQPVGEGFVPAMCNSLARSPSPQTPNTRRGVANPSVLQLALVYNNTLYWPLRPDINGPAPTGQWASMYVSWEGGGVGGPPLRPHCPPERGRAPAPRNCALQPAARAAVRRWFHACPRSLVFRRCTSTAA